MLFIVMFMIVLFTFIERKNIADVNRSVTSIYNDRLVPATDIFYLSEHLYGKRFLTEQFLQSETENFSAVQAGLDKHNESIHSLIGRFEKTYLVDEESRYLNNLKISVAEYLAIEKKIMRLANSGSKNTARMLYENMGKKSLQASMKQLSLLTQVQTTAGSQLIKDSNGKVATSSMISNLQIVLSIIIGLIILSLIFAAGISNAKGKDFRWN